MKKILVDCDGVVADMLPPLLEKLAKHPDCRKFTVDEIECWEFMRDQFTEWERTVADSIMQDGAFWASLPLIEHAQESIKKLKEMNWEVVFCTSPYDNCVEWEYRRRHWLYNNFQTKKHDIICSLGKYHIDGDLMIDDNSEYLEKWLARFPSKKSILFKYNYNKNSNLFGFSNWPDIISYIETLK